MFANFFKNLIVNSFGTYIEVLISTIIFYLGLHQQRHRHRQVEWAGHQGQRGHQEIGSRRHLHESIRCTGDRGQWVHLEAQD